MPCRDGGPSYNAIEGDALRNRLDAATRSACESCKALQKLGMLDERFVSKETIKWFAQHLKEDEARARKDHT